MARESSDDRKKRLSAIIRILTRQYPDARTALNWSAPLDLLVATILSAQCTDVRVNLVTAELFKKYKTARHYANVSQEVLESEIRSTGFFRNKARSIRGAARKIIDEYGGKVPDNMEDLLTLPGVARKTANVVLGSAFGKCEGIVVDTHVSRVSQRLKLTSNKNNQGDRIEKDLQAIVPKTQWILFSHLLIFHGRNCCVARKPHCDRCPISHLCPSAFKV